jgi:hypothetical protein
MTDVNYTCGTCGKPIKTGCYCSKACADADDMPEQGHDPDLDENNVCRVCGKYEPE